MTAHALLSPSSAHAWRICAGMPTLLRRIVNPLPRDDTASREGTAAHWAAAEMLADRMVAEGQITPDGVVLTAEMLQSAELFVDTVRQVLDRATSRPTPTNHGIEQRLAGYGPDRFGTPDAWLWDVNGQVLDIVDFKHGFDIVEVFENWQALDYAGMLRQQLQLPDTARVRITIVQPRAPHRDGPVRTWTTTIGALHTYWHQLDMAADEATSATPQLRPNPACRRCDARHECPALQVDAYRSAQVSAEAMPLALSDEALGLEIAHLTDAAERLKGRLSGLQAQADAALRGGRRVPGWTLEPGQTRLAWTVPVVQIKALGLMAGKPLVTEEPITPTQARALLKGTPHVAVVDAMSARPPAAMKLARDDGSEARRVFGAG